MSGGDLEVEQHSMTRLFERSVSEHADRPAIVANGETLTYGELGRRARRVAELLAETATGNPRVALLAENSSRYAILYWGILLSGGVTVELNPRLGDGELGEQLLGADPGALIAERRLGPRLERLGHSLDAHGPIAVGSFDAAREGFAARLSDILTDRDRQQSARTLPHPSSDALASIVYTSGTTGRVQGVCLTHGNLAWVARAIAASFGLEDGDPTERLSGNLPLFYTYGKSVLHLATHLGASILFAKHVLTPESLLRLVDRHEVTHLSLVPYLCSLLLRSPRFTSAELPRLRRITIAGGALARPLMEQMLRRFPGRVIPMYGLTEASTRVTCMPPDETARRPASCGRPLAGVQVKVTGESEDPPAPRAVGEILVRGPNVMQGYFRDSAPSDDVIRAGWLRTGDLGFLDSDGFLTIAGRRKDIIKVMGETVAAAPIESAIASMPAVAEVAVTRLPDDVLGEAIAAFIVRREGSPLDRSAVRRHCADRLGRLRVPTHVRFVAKLPKTSSGKVRKHLLALDGRGDGDA